MKAAAILVLLAAALAVTASAGKARLVLIDPLL